MCGIVGYVGSKNAQKVLIAGLKKLEYRGYDSCGIATILDNKFDIHKSIKRINDLEKIVEKENQSSSIGIGHTRWATHGGATVLNAHPHVSNSKNIAVVHNGIIENYNFVKDMLKKKGFTFYSETDTEVIPNLIELKYNENGGNLLLAVKQATDILEGSYALGIIDVNHPNELIATKKNSPLIVGLGENENFIASDFSAIVKYTNNISVLENSEFAILKQNETCFFDNNLNLQAKEIKTIDINDSDIEKNGYEHFMLKEINENTITIKNMIDDYFENDMVKFSFDFSKEELKKINAIHIVACGTAMHAGLVGKTIIEKLTRIPVNVYVASEFRYQEPIINENDFAIFISQSGETADTIACLELVKEKNIQFVSVVNVKDSTIDRLSKNIIYTKAGVEVAVASTKAYVAQVCALDLFAIYLAQKLNSYDSNRLADLIYEFKNIHTKVQIVLEHNTKYLDYAKKIYKARDVFYLGRGIDYVTSLEGSLKLKEISYIHSEATPFGELKHGPIALIEEKTPAIVICTVQNLVQKVISNIKEIKARGADVLLITNQEIPENSLYDNIIEIPKVDELLSPLLSIVPLQLIAYHVTVLKKLDVDKPRNLAKSVTVE